MSSARAFLQEIKDAAQQMGLAPSTLCQKAARCGGLIRRLEEGGEVTLGRVEQIRAYIREHQRAAPTEQQGAAE